MEIVGLVRGIGEVGVFESVMVVVVVGGGRWCVLEKVCAVWEVQEVIGMGLKEKFGEGGEVVGLMRN